jgi:hypothetical protein
MGGAPRLKAYLETESVWFSSQYLTWFPNKLFVWEDAHGSTTVGGPIDDGRVGLAPPPIGKLDHQPRL